MRVIHDIPFEYLLILSAIMFFIGIYGFITRRNLFAVLMSTELVLNAVALNFVACNYYLYPDKMQGVFFALFIIGIAAAEAAVAIAIIIALYRSRTSVNVDEAQEMKY